MIYFQTLKRFSLKVIKGFNYSRKYPGLKGRIWFFHLGVSFEIQAVDTFLPHDTGENVQHSHSAYD